jgi:hypothetical protein
VGCCNRLGRAMWTWPMFLGFPEPVYINACPAAAIDTHQTDLDFAFHVTACVATLAYIIPESTGKRKSGSLEPLAFAILYGRRRIMFWEALYATTHVLHHGSPSIQVRRCFLPPLCCPLQPYFTTAIMNNIFAFVCK